MDLWNETACYYSPTEITVARYDPYRELVWIGCADGYISSFYGSALSPYVSFKAHNGMVKDIQLSDQFVVSLGLDGLSCHTRSGLLSSRCTPAKGDKVLLLDNSEFLVTFKRRVAKYQISPQIKEIGFFQIDSIPTTVSITHISRCAPNIALGLSDGTVEVIEPKTFDTTLPKPLPCHSGPITDIDSQKNVLVSCGLSHSRFGGSFADAFITHYDTRAHKLQPPLTVSNGATYVKLHPKATNHVVVLGKHGQLTFLDTKNTTQVTIKFLVMHEDATSLDIGPLGDSLVVTEKNYLHHWSNKGASKTFDNFKGLDVPTALDLSSLLVDDDAPLSSIGMPFYNQELLSTWNMNDVFETGMPTPHWDEVKNPYISCSHASSLKRQTRYRRPSLVSVPRFLSEKARQNDNHEQSFVDIVKELESEKGKVPKLWRRMHVHYSKFGVDDFDFSYYNTTAFSSLEPLSASPFCNALIQLYRWCPTIYNSVLTTFACNNSKELSATGELAIILDMLLDANGHHCRATNFMDTLQLDVRLTEMHNLIFKQLEYEHLHEIGSKSPLLEFIKTEYLPLINKDTKLEVDSKYRALFLQVHAVVEQAPKSLGQFALRGYVSEVVDFNGERHGVAVINEDGKWYLFNDFLVSEICEEDALDFSNKWNRPCMFLYHNTSTSHTYDLNWKEKISLDLLYDQKFRSGNWDYKPIYPDLMLRKDEPIPKVVALDAEFVLVRKELAEIHSDGTKHLISPKKLSLARVSVLRDDEKVLIDDIVESNQPVVDYLTAFSGVEPGDLDPTTSRYGLVARKTATRRLWILLKLGTKFVGHALMNDFRTINLYAPPKQVIDTYNLFYDQTRNGMRRLSLKFLMWAVLDEHVQRGNHDSVQDAQSALRLYKRYEELEIKGEVDAMLDKVWAMGQQCNYKVPLRSNGEASIADTTIDDSMMDTTIET